MASKASTARASSLEMTSVDIAPHRSNHGPGRPEQPPMASMSFTTLSPSDSLAACLLRKSEGSATT